VKFNGAVERIGISLWRSFLEIQSLTVIPRRMKPPRSGDSRSFATRKKGETIWVNKVVTGRYINSTSPDTPRLLHSVSVLEHTLRIMVSINENDSASTRGLLAPDTGDRSPLSSRAPSPLPGPLPSFHDENISSTLSSPTLPPHPPLLAQEISTLYPPAEPVPLANPPPYRSISIRLPAYTPRWQKEPDDLEEGGAGVRGLRRANTLSRRYPSLPKYGWQVWGAIVFVTFLTVVSIVIAVVKTAKP